MRRGSERRREGELGTTSLARLGRNQGKRPETHDPPAPIYGWFTRFDTPPEEANALLDELAL